MDDRATLPVFRFFFVFSSAAIRRGPLSFFLSLFLSFFPSFLVPQAVSVNQSESKWDEHLFRFLSSWLLPFVAAAAAAAAADAAEYDLISP